MASGIEIKGLDAVNRYLQRLVVGTPAEAGKALFRRALPIIAHAKERTPVLTGALRESGHVQPPVVDGSSVRVVMGFGGAASGYAIHVHENLTAHHPNGEAKFFEKAVLAAIPALRQEIAADLADVFKDVK